MPVASIVASGLLIVMVAVLFSGYHAVLKKG